MNKDDLVHGLKDLSKKALAIPNLWHVGIQITNLIERIEMDQYDTVRIPEGVQTDNETWVIWRGQKIIFTRTEMRVLHVLWNAYDHVAHYKAIYISMCLGVFLHKGSGPNGHKSNVRSTMKRIRNKFKAVDTQFNEILNISGVGYLWKVPSNQ